MKRWILAASQFYPREWRQEYGEEFDALLEDLNPGWKVFANVLRGAITMQITKGTGWWKIAGAVAVAGGLVAIGISFSTPPTYVSTAVMQVTPQPDPLRPAAPEVLQQRAAEHLQQLQTEILSRTSLAETIQKPSLNLYKPDRQRVPMEDVVQKMRRDIRIAPLDKPGAFVISFAYSDQQKAQAVMRELVTKFVETNLTVDRYRGLLYRNFWQDQARAHGAPPPPPPPTGEIMAVLDPPTLPTTPLMPNLAAFLVGGLGAGFLVGLAVVLALRHGRRLSLIAGCAAAGFVLAAAGSFVIPDRYTSTAVMRITPPQITEDPLAPPTLSDASARWPELERTVLSRANLAAIIQKPRLSLYPDERTRKPLEEVVDQMRDRDIRISHVAASAISISFSYPDRYKAQSVVREMVTLFTELNVMQARAQATNQSVIRQEIEAHKAGENLEVLDPATLPESPVSPHRLIIAILGSALGVLIGLAAIRYRRPRPPQADYAVA
jgi:uncharacterized protein involved in exopolysaccharide biosynthesis